MANIFEVDRTNNIVIVGTTGTTLRLPFCTGSRLAAFNGDSDVTNTDIASWITGTANQITVTDDGDGTITLSASQSIGIGSTPQFAGIELGHASDTTLTRVSAGVVAVEGTNIAMVGGAHHDGFSDFVANEHTDHTSVTLTAGTGLTGGGDISANRTFAVDGLLEDLDTLGANSADSEFLVGTGAGALAWESGATARTSLGVAIGTNVQAWDASLDSIAALTYASDSFIKVTAEDTYAIRTIAETKTDLSLNLVENTALSTWVGTTNITTLGTISTVGNITIADGGTIGQAAGPLLTFDDTNNYLEITGCKVGIGTNTPGTPGYAKFHLKGTDSNATGPHMIFETDADAYPIIQILNWAHDNIAIGFDSYYDGTHRSSDAGSNLRLEKHGDLALFRYDSGVAQGAEITWNDAMVIDLTNGNTGIGITPKTKFTVEGALTLKEQAAADGDTAAYGQDWVKTATPCQRWFTDDTGVDYQLSGITTGVLNHSFTWDAPEIADGDEAATSVTVTGAAFGDFVLVSFSANVFDLVLTGQVTSANIVTVVLANNTGAARDLASGTCYIRVLKK